jgi:hypothetical protein
MLATDEYQLERHHQNLSHHNDQGDKEVMAVDPDSESDVSMSISSGDNTSDDDEPEEAGSIDHGRYPAFNSGRLELFHSLLLLTICLEDDLSRMSYPFSKIAPDSVDLQRSQQMAHGPMGGKLLREECSVIVPKSDRSTGLLPSLAGKQLPVDDQIYQAHEFHHYGGAQLPKEAADIGTPCQLDTRYNCQTVNPRDRSIVAETPHDIHTMRYTMVENKVPPIMIPPKSKVGGGIATAQDGIITPT